MTRSVFVTGTDTGVGKTVVAVALLRSLCAAGFRAAGMKPVAAGLAPGEEVNADVAMLMQAGNVAAPVADVNPYSFVPAIAPHLAAQEAGVEIELERIEAAHARLAAIAEAIVIEGAGGALVPLDRGIDLLDIAVRLGRVPVVLVVGIRLGCLNHALLSALAIDARGLEVAGWVANRIDPAMREADDNVAALAERLPAPLIGDFAWRPDAAPAFEAGGVLAALGFMLRFRAF